MATTTETRDRYDLTPRQREVMELIAAGRTNPEIAEALGVSLDGAKYHVREILSKLGVASREEAVRAWREDRHGRRWRWLGASFGLSKVAAVVAVLAAVAAGIGVAIALLVGGNDDEPASPGEASATPSVTQPASATPAPSSTPAATPETIAGVEVKPLTLGGPIPLPDNVALYIERGCWGCDAPAESLQRVYRAPDGTLRTEDLYVGADPVGPDPGYIMSISAETANDIIISICDGPTYCGGVANTFEGSKSSVRHSTDGGITWTTGPQIDGGMWFAANMRGGTGGAFGLISREVHPSAGVDISTLSFYPSLDPAPVARTAIVLDSANGPPLVLGDDGISLYRVEGGTTSNPWFHFESLPPGSVVADLQFVANGVAVTWRSPDGTMYTGIGSTQATPAGSDAVFTEIFRWPNELQPFFHRPQGGFINERTMIIAVPADGNGQVPAVIDFDAAAIRRISDFSSDLGTVWNRNRVKAVQTGPFARVANTGGECLNVREAPSLSAASFACYPDGVLLVEQGQRTDADGATWALVMAGDRQGWASTEFLEMTGSAPSLNFHPAGTRTGIAEVDPVIAALEESATVSRALIAWQKVAREKPPVQGIGGPPECPDGVEGGTEIDVISGAACEGYWRTRPADGSGVQLVVGPEDRLYGVIDSPSLQGDWPPAAEYVVVFASDQIPGQFKVVYVSDSGVVGDWSGCGTTPGQLIEIGGTYVFPPPSP